MDHFYRLILVVVLALLGGNAFADGGPFPATPGQYDTSVCNPQNYPKPAHFGTEGAWLCRPHSSLPNTQNCGWMPDNPLGFAGACNQTFGAPSCPAGANAGTSESDGSPTCTCTAGLRPVDGQCVASPVCPEGQHEEGGACVPDNCKPNETRVNGVCVPEPPCPAGQTRVNGKCQPFKCPDKGTVSDQWYELTSNSSAATCLYNNQDNTYCTMTIQPSVIASSGGVTSYVGGYGVYTGGTCGPSEPGKPTPQDPDKPEGDPDKGTKPPGPKDPKPGDKPGGPTPGGPGANPTPPNTNGDCPPGTYKSNGGCYPKDPPKQPPDGDGKCPAGYVKVGSECIPLMPKPDSEGDGEDDKPESNFSGACQGGFACEGDAIQCSIAKEQHRRACKLFDDVNAETQLYDTEKVKTGKRTDDLPGNATHEFGSGMYDSSNMLPGGSCIADVTVDVLSTSVTLPFSRVCPLLGYLRLALLAFGALAWVLIVFRG